VFIHKFVLKNPANILFKKRWAVYSVSFICLFILLLPLTGLFTDSNDSRILRRVNFSRASYRMIKDHPLFGVGWNNSTVLMDEYNYETRDLKFVQPVHNIFLLVFSEAGVFSFILFAAFLYVSGKKLINSSYFHLFLISFLQILILGSFDHYFLTINQTLLLFWIVLGLSLQ
jgi:O-antigen ligase